MLNTICTKYGSVSGAIIGAFVAYLISKSESKKSKINSINNALYLEMFKGCNKMFLKFDDIYFKVDAILNDIKISLNNGKQIDQKQIRDIINDYTTYMNKIMLYFNKEINDNNNEVRILALNIDKTVKQLSKCVNIATNIQQGKDTKENFNIEYSKIKYLFYNTNSQLLNIRNLMKKRIIK